MIINVDTDSLSIAFENMKICQFDRVMEMINELTFNESEDDF